MTDDPNAPCVLVPDTNEIDAAAIVAALAEYDIEASVNADFASGFRFEATGNIKIVVKRSDFNRAKLALAEIREDQGKVDWSAIDVGEPEEGTGVDD